MPSPELSAIVPTHNRGRLLRRCLEALAVQTQPASDFEVVVVVDGSTDNTCAMLDSFAAPYRLRVIQQRNCGQQIARNAGAARAQGRFLLFLDDDIVPAADLVAEHLRAQRERNGVLAIGKLPFRLNDDAHWFVRSMARSWELHYRSLADGRRAPMWAHCCGGNLSCPRSAFLEVGGFAPELRYGEDIELGLRLEERGVRVVYVPGAVGWQEEHKTFEQLLMDTENHGASWVELCRRHPRTFPMLLGSYTTGRRRTGLWLRRVLLAVDAPPALLGIVGSLSRNPAFHDRWYRFLGTYCHWRGIWRVLDADVRRRLASGTAELARASGGTR